MPRSSRATASSASRPGPWRPGGSTSFTPPPRAARWGRRPGGGGPGRAGGGGGGRGLPPPPGEPRGGGGPPRLAQPLDELVRAAPVGERVVGQHEPVAQHVAGEVAHVVVYDVGP